ncbi:hypothetical protein TRVL_06797 [Trypanosoma vivax]|nr:hypothetical protein TRVL_06797 [Trypanosoma vivax]
MTRTQVACVYNGQKKRTMRAKRGPQKRDAQDGGLGHVLGHTPRRTGHTLSTQKEQPTKQTKGSQHAQRRTAATVHRKEAKRQTHTKHQRSVAQTNKQREDTQNNTKTQRSERGNEVTGRMLPLIKRNSHTDERTPCQRLPNTKNTQPPLRETTGTGARGNANRATRRGRGARGNEGQATGSTSSTSSETRTRDTGNKH